MEGSRRPVRRPECQGAAGLCCVVPYPVNDRPYHHGSATGKVLFAPGVLIDGALLSHGRLSEKKLRRALAKRRRDPSPRSVEEAP